MAWCKDDRELLISELYGVPFLQIPVRSRVRLTAGAQDLCPAAGHHKGEYITVRVKDCTPATLLCEVVE